MKASSRKTGVMETARTLGLRRSGEGSGCVVHSKCCQRGSFAETPRALELLLNHFFVFLKQIKTICKGSKGNIERCGAPDVVMLFSSVIRFLCSSFMISSFFWESNVLQMKFHKLVMSELKYLFEVTS